MKRSAIWALGAALTLPGVAFAQEAWDGQFNTDQLNDTFLSNSLVDFAFEEGVDLELQEFDDAGEEAIFAERGIDEYAEFRLIEAVLNDNTKPHHTEIRNAFIAAYPIVDDHVFGTTAGLAFRKQASKVLTAFMLRNKEMAVEIGTAFDIDGANAFTPAELSQITEQFELLSASGDLDDDGDTNLEEWESTAKAVTHSQSYLDRVAAFVVSATAGTQVNVDVSPITATIVKGGTVQLSAISSDAADTSFVWTSDDENIATVDSDGTVTGGTETGTVTITAEGSSSGASGEASITVIVPQWYDVCTLDDDFAGQGTTLTGVGTQLGLPFTTWTDASAATVFDVDQDGVADHWQTQHLAFALCQGSNNDLESDFADNLDNLQTFVGELGAFVSFLDGVDGDMTSFAGLLGADANAATVNNASTLAEPTRSFYAAAFASFGGLALPVASAFGAIGGQFGDTVDDFEPVVAVLPVIDDVLAALGGQSTEARAAIVGLVPTGDVALAIQVSQVLAAVAADVAPRMAANQATGGALALELSGVPSVNALNFTVYDDGGKALGEPFAGLGDYNNDGTNNATIAGFVEGANGDSEDYVAGVTGELGPFWAGNPELPAAAVFGLGAVLSALSAAGAFALRRKK